MALEDSVNPMQGISGPGSFSKRTDLQYQSQAYGDGVAYDAAKAGAPLAKTPDVRGATATEINQAVEQTPVTSLYAPTQRPDEPITTGIDMGPGAGSDILMGSPQPTEKLSDTLAKMLPYDQTGEVAILYQNALARGM